MGANEELQRQATEGDSGLTAEERAHRLRSALLAQAEDSESKEAEAGEDSARYAPPRAAAGVAEHEREMADRGFEREGPPQH